MADRINFTALALGAVVGIGGAVYAKQVKPNQLAAAAIIGGGLGYVIGDRLESLNPLNNLRDAAGNVKSAVRNTGRKIKGAVAGGAKGAKAAARGATKKARSAAKKAKSRAKKATKWRPW